MVWAGEKATVPYGCFFLALGMLEKRERLGHRQHCAQPPVAMAVASRHHVRAAPQLRSSLPLWSSLKRIALSRRKAELNFSMKLKTILCFYLYIFIKLIIINIVLWKMCLHQLFRHLDSLTFGCPGSGS